ncbi:MAG: ABC transporter ATP-binding protein [Rubricoccaceae bacterium]
MTNAPVLEARGLTKRFDGVTALDGLELAVASGEVVALLGPNGAGKTTAINLLLGFLTPDAGTARVCGVDVAADPLAARRALAYIPEQVQLYPALTGLENLGYLAALAGRTYAEAALTGFLRQAGLPEQAHHRRVETYSKGMRQKVGVALALARDARALLLDEPTSGLDPAASHEFSGLLRALAGRGVGVLMATHDLFRVQDTADRVAFLVGGRLVETLGGDALARADLQARYLVHVADAARPVRTGQAAAF